MTSAYSIHRAIDKFMLTPKKLEEIDRMDKAFAKLRQVEKETAERNAVRKEEGERSKYYYEDVLVSGRGGNSLQGRGAAQGGVDYHIYEVISPTEVKKVAKIDSTRILGQPVQWKRYKFVVQKFEFKKDKTNKLIIKKDGKIHKVLNPMTTGMMAGFKEAMSKPIEKPVKD